MGCLVDIDVVVLMKPEQGRFGIVANLHEAPFNSAEAVGEPIVTKPDTPLNLADAERMERWCVSHRLLSAQFQKDLHGGKVISNHFETRSASSGVLAASSGERAGAAALIGRQRNVAAISCSMHKRTSGSVDLICSAVKVKLVNVILLPASSRHILFGSMNPALIFVPAGPALIRIRTGTVAAGRAHRHCQRVLFFKPQS